MNSVTDLLLDETLVNESGKIKFVGVDLEIYSVENFIKKVLDLHLRSTGQKPLITLKDAPSLDESKKLYRGMITTFLCSYQYLTSETKRQLLDEIIKKVYARKTAEAFESVFLTTLASLEGELDPMATEFYFIKFSTFGWPKFQGGGYQTSYLADRNDEFLGVKADFEADFNELKLNVNYYHSVKEKIKAKQAQYYTMTTTQCVAKFSVGGAIVGGAIGAGMGAAGSLGAGTVPGAAIGIEKGAMAGGIIGGIYCDDIINDDPAPAKDKPAEAPGKDKETEKDEETPEAYIIEIVEQEDGGCISPYANDFVIANPYAKAIESRKVRSAMPYGRGAFQYIKKSGSYFKTENMPKFTYMAGKIDLQSLGYLKLSKGLSDSITEYNKISSPAALLEGDKNKKIKAQKKTTQKVDKKDTVTNFGKDKVNATPLIPEEPAELLAKTKNGLAKKGIL